jgi:hypothetical protein
LYFFLLSDSSNTSALTSSPDILFFFFFFSFFFFCSTGVWAHGLMLARQVFCYLSCQPKPWYSVFNLIQSIAEAFNWVFFFLIWLIELFISTVSGVNFFSGFLYLYWIPLWYLHYLPYVVQLFICILLEFIQLFICIIFEFIQLFIPVFFDFIIILIIMLLSSLGFLPLHCP